MFSQTRIPSATLNHTPQPSARSHKPNRKPVFRVFCDDHILEPSPTANPAHPRTDKPSTAFQTVVNNKENQLPELNNRSISAPRQTARSIPRTRVLGEKPASARVNCADKWPSNIPFAPCESSPAKFNQLEPIATENLIPRVTSHSQSGREPKRKSQTTPSQTNPTKRLSSHVSCRATDTPSQPSTHLQAVADGLNELVAKLEALQATDDEALELLDPLPPNATCPGAPKMPSTFTMPLFVADDGHCDDGQAFERKSPNSLRMSPLAEVTEAFTGLQGGWSPPLEALSPVLHDHLSHPTSSRTNLS